MQNGPGRTVASAVVTVLAAVLATAWPAAPARAEFTGRATTVFRVFDRKQELTGLDKTVSFRPLDQYAWLSWSDLGARDAWHVEMSLRGRLDLETSGVGAEDDFDVLRATARWRSPENLVELTLGRQLAVHGFGWRTFDGVRADFSKMKRARFFVFAGLPIEPFESDAPDGDSRTWGGGATVVFPSRGSIGVDYEVRRFEGVRTEETVGLDAHVEGGGFAFSANADYSVLLDSFGETTALLSRTFDRHRVEARFSRVQPIFPSDTIWAVFAINPYDERRVSWEYLDPSGLAIGAFFSDEQYEETEFPGPQDIQRAAVTVQHRPPGQRLRMRGEVGWQAGFSGDRLAVRFDTSWQATPRLNVGGGASVNRYENAFRLTEEDETVALRARVRHDHDGRWDLGLDLEQFFGRDRDTLRATLAFTVKLGRARRERPWWGGPLDRAWGGGATPRRDAAKETAQ